MTSFEKKKISIRYWLLVMASTNPLYFKCLDAMELAMKFHVNIRKDGFTPEFDHQLTIVHYVRTLVPSLTYPVETICTVFLHDLREDYNISNNEIEEKFGALIANAVERMTKTFRGAKKSNTDYFKSISECEIASIAKGGDRIHNFQSMPTVFTSIKQQEYIQEAEEWIIPALKISRRLFPKQELAYENIKLMLRSQIELINHSLNGAD